MVCPLQQLLFLSILVLLLSNVDSFWFLKNLSSSKKQKDKIKDDLINAIQPKTIFTQSDIILYKVPKKSNKLKINESDLVFKKNKDLRSIPLLSNDKYELLVVTNEELENVYEAFLGNIISKDNKIPYKIKINYNGSSNEIKKTKPVKVKSFIKNNRKSNKKVIRKDKDGEIQIIKDVKKYVKSMNNSFCEEIFYSFNIDEDSNDEYIEPSIVRLCMNDPIIVIKNHKKEAIKRNDIDVIIKEEKNISIEVELKDGEMVIGEDSFGYKIINASRVMYERSEVFNEIEAIEVSEDNTFEMQNFGFVMLSYNCEYCWNSTKVIKKLIFFRPKETVYDEGLIFYNNSNFVPFCLLNDERFGYLVKLTKNNIEVDILSPNGQYQINGDKAFLLGTDGSGVVKCTYMTPVGEFNTMKNFYTINHISSPKSKRRTTTISYFGIFLCSLFLFVILFLIIGLVTYTFSSKTKYYISDRKHRIKYSNIYYWWNYLKHNSINNYSKVIIDKRYFPKNDSQKGKGNNKGLLINSIEHFDEFLVTSQRSSKTIMAHKVYNSSTFGSIILSDYPDNSTINSFWKMVHDENIDIIISLTFDDYEPDEIKRYIYWKLSMEAHGDLTVDYVKTSYLEMMNTSALTFNLITGDDNIKSLTIFHIKGWKINSVPKSSHDLKKLYENIIETDSTNNVLIHTTYGGNTKIYIFAYFLAMVDSLIYDRSDKDPMEVIKLIRSKRYGGIIGPLEFAYLIHSIVEYFIDKKIIKDRKGFSKFHREYEKFFDEITYIPKAIDNNLKNFIYFMKMYDKVMMEEICKQELLKTVLKNDVIMKKCRRFIHAENFCASKKSSYNLNRYQYAYCFDEYAVNGGNFIIPGDTIPGYINANEITYRLIDGSERKIIMCQLPTKGTLHGVFDMFFEQDVSSVAVLLNPEEMESFIPYLKCNKEEQDYGTFQIILLEKRQFADKNSLSYRFKIIKGSKAEIDINIFIYTEWNDKDLPNNMVSFYKFYIGLVHNIYKKPLVIQCRAGIGRTGLLALLIYSIDNISSSRPFDLIRNLHFISSHRYRAIENTKQLFFTLDVILYHFKNELKNTNEYSFESISSKFKSTTTSLPSNRIKGKYKLRKSVR